MQYYSRGILNQTPCGPVCCRIYVWNNIRRSRAVTSAVLFSLYYFCLYHCVWIVLWWLNDCSLFVFWLEVVFCLKCCCLICLFCFDKYYTHWMAWRRQQYINELSFIFVTFKKHATTVNLVTLKLFFIKDTNNKWYLVTSHLIKFSIFLKLITYNPNTEAEAYRRKVSGV